MGQGAARVHGDLEVYRLAFDAAMQIFEYSKRFPVEERYALTDQVRRSSRSVCANLGEAWRKRRYQAAFVAKLSDSEAEAAETQIWIEFAVKCGYLERDTGKALYETYNQILGKLVSMIKDAPSWTIRVSK
jgi:four helix bundle protein